MLLLSIANFIAMSFEPASLSLRRLRVHETTRLQVADALGFAIASQTTSLQDNKPATAPLVVLLSGVAIVSLTSCLVVCKM